MTILSFLLSRQLSRNFADQNYKYNDVYHREHGALSSLNTKYAVHWLTGQFCEHRMESMFRRSMKARVRFESRLSLILVALIFGMFAITDYHLLGLTKEYYLLVTMRIVVVSLCFLLALIIGRYGNYFSKKWLHALPLWILATGIILIVPLRPESLTTQITAVVVATMAFFLLIPNLLTVVTFASLYLSVGFLAAAVLFADLSPVVTLRLALLLVMTNIVGFCALLRLENLQRKQFGLLQKERNQNRHLLKEIALRKDLEAQLRMVAERDELTGLDSRSHFMKRAKALLQRSRLEKKPFSLFMIDVDHFKKINDTWGHTHGDWVLTKIAEACAQTLRPTDVIGRFGGEEFIVALPDTGPDNAQTVAERLKKKVAELPLKEEMSEMRLSVTIGIALASTEDADLDSLITRADHSLYVGKRDGRNRVVMNREGAEEG
ncbi:diguanylate cyclase [Billgrantia diversa]|uniref:diguanylate cyclase n=1 Tax=Halomonas sp. MCCC 1A13316 TaxID=2733487 RepID=UPI0018A3C579|nr:diguanylate cyclase [Halomonas sp. MCCC 1A13316]QOR37713.1 diguanylate cyclase [Halomonas sp. MCCC 1A13316]